MKLLSVLGALACAEAALLLRGGDATRALNMQYEYRIPLENYGNVQYMGPITVGSQTLPAIYDTGSFQIVVLSTLCRSCTGGTAVVYDSTQSSSFSQGHTTTTHSFGSGDVVSEEGFDTIRFGDAGSPHAVPQMPFWQVVENYIDVWGPYAKFSGIVGLGYPDRVPQGYGGDEETPLKRSGVRSFGLCLQRDTPKAPGWLSIEPSVPPSIFSSVPVRGHIHWAVTMTGLEADGGSFSQACSPSCGAIIDSGTSLLAVPPQAQGMVNWLKGQIRSDCSNLHSLPSLRFRLGAAELELPPAAYVLQEGWGAGRWCSHGFMDIDMQSQLGPVFILGMSFLRYYTAVFDKSNMQIHFAESNADCSLNSHLWLAANSTQASHLSNTSHFSSARRAFSGADYVPTSAESKKARLPKWAQKKGQVTI